MPSTGQILSGLENVAKCPGCGGTFPLLGGPVHRYMESSPGCWAAYGVVLAREYSDPACQAWSTHHEAVRRWLPPQANG